MDGRPARGLEVCRGEVNAQKPDRYDARTPRRLGVIRRIADHQGVSSCDFRAIEGARPRRSVRPGPNKGNSLTVTSVYVPKHRHCFLNIRSARGDSDEKPDMYGGGSSRRDFRTGLDSAYGCVRTKRSAYAAKEAACKERASRMKFGIHFVKRNRWVKECIVGAA